MYEVAKAIDYAHGRGIVHRDLKPENILFDAQAGNIAKVSDFGLAGFLEDSAGRFNVTATHVAMGTLAYMAPEQRVDAKKADHRADIYSLGVMLYEVLTGDAADGQLRPGGDLERSPTSTSASTPSSSAASSPTPPIATRRPASSSPPSSRW